MKWSTSRVAANSNSLVHKTNRMHKNQVTNHRILRDQYPYLPVEAQTRAPLSNRICTHSGRLCRDAKCNGVAPFPSLTFTNRTNPLQPIQEHLKNHNNIASKSKSIQEKRIILKKKKDKPRSSHMTRLSRRKNSFKARKMAIISSIV